MLDPFEDPDLTELSDLTDRRKLVDCPLFSRLAGSLVRSADFHLTFRCLS